MAAKQPVPTPQYCIQHSRCTKQDGWRMFDLTLSLNRNIAVTGYNENTHRTYIDVYTNVRHSGSRVKPKVIYSKEFEKYQTEIGNHRARFVSFIGDDVLVCCLGDKLEVFQVSEGEVLRSRKVNGRARCLSVRDRREIFIGFRQSNKINVYDVMDLNEIKSIILQGIRDGYWPYSMTAIADRIFVCEVYYGEESNQRSLIFEEKNGEILSELTKPTDTEQWYVFGLALNITLNVIAVAWSQTWGETRKGKDVIVFYSLLSENSCGFLTVEVEIGIKGIRISDRGDRMFTGNRVGSGEVKVYDMADFFTYDHLRENLISQLQRDECVRLINYFFLPHKQADVIWKSRSPKESLLLALEKLGVIKTCNVDRLLEAFHELKFTSSCYYLLDFYRQTRKSRFVNEDIADLTASFNVMKSKPRMRSDRQSQRWAGMISRIDSADDTFKSVGSIKYSKEEKIGTGSSGSHIFGGKFGNKTVAVKRVVSENVQRESELHSFMKTKTMCNVLKILHVEEDEYFTYIVTELCEYDLKAVIEDNTNPIGASLSPEKRVKLCMDILRGLRDLHSIDVIHRDLKPSNILIGVDGEAYVADFGISRNLIGETTHATGFYGTLCWIAREGMQSENDKVRYKKESDVQVAGCLVYYVLSNGHHPFEATSPFIKDTAKLMNNVAEGTYSLFHIEIYHAQCTALLKRMLDKDMLKRPSLDDCLKEMEAVRYAARTMTSILPRGELASAAAVAVPNTAYLSESEIPDEFSRLIVKISSSLTRGNCIYLARLFRLSRAKTDEIKKESDTPGLDLLDTMIERNNINMYDLTHLQKALADLQLNEINETLVIPYQRKIDPRTHERHKIFPQSP